MSDGISAFLALPEDGQDHRVQGDLWAASPVKVLSLWRVEMMAVGHSHPAHLPHPIQTCPQV